MGRPMGYKVSEATKEKIRLSREVNRITLVAGQNTGAGFIATNDFDQVYVDNAEITDVCE